MQAIASSLPDMSTQAVLMLLEGRQREALCLFYDCIAVAKELHDSGLLPARNTFCQSINECIVSPIALEDVFALSQDSANDRVYMATNCFRLFKKAFVFDLEEITCHQTLMALVSSIHYNVAVVYQEYGLYMGDPEWLSRALRFYQVTQELIQQDFLDTMVSTLDLALCNNMGHLYAFFSKDEGVVEMRCRLQSRLQFYGVPLFHQDQDVYNFFHYSVQLAKSRVGNTIAPAA